MSKPSFQAVVDLLLGLIRVFALEVLPHEANTGLEEIHGDTKSLGRAELYRFVHTSILSVRALKALVCFGASSIDDLGAKGCIVGPAGRRPIELARDSAYDPNT